MNEITKEINGKSYKFKFGIRFVAELDKLVSIKQDGIPFSVGAAIKFAQLKNVGDLVVLSEILKIANETETPKVGKSTLDDWLENGLSLEEIDELIAEVIEVLENSNATAGKMKALAAEQVEK